jgi:hypothetical protein
MEDAMTGDHTDGEMRAINRCAYQTFAQLMAWQQIPKSWATWRRFLRTYTRDSTNNRLRQTLGLWTQPDLRHWPAYYDAFSQMLCQVEPQKATATPGASSTSCTYKSARRFMAVS